jgi:preprotein translocase subunit SecA
VRTLMLALLDHLWTEQTERLEHLRRIIGDRRLSANRAVAEFETEAFTMLKFLTTEFRHEVTAHAMRLGFSG